MSRLTRTLATILFAAMAVGPVSAATAYAAQQVAQAGATGSVSGTAATTEGAPIPSASVTLVGAHSYSTTTDVAGHFTINDVTAGFYRLTVVRAGYQTAQNDISVVAGATQQVSVVMPVATFTSLRTIAHVTVRGRGTFNTTTAAVNTLSAADFSSQGQYSVNHTLDQIPGLQISYPTSSANGASPGAIVVPNIRGGLSYETATLIDGHPLAVVDYGDYVTTFLNSYLFSSVEVVKGPGAMSPETNYAIGGTLNFHTKDPTLTFTPDYTVGCISDGGTYWNLGVSDTVLNGKLGFVLDTVGVADPGLIHNKTTYFNVKGGNAVIGWNGTTGNVANYNDAALPIVGTSSFAYSSQGLVACCYSYNGYFNQYGDLLKVTYNFSSSTRAMVSYLVTESYADQNANTAATLETSYFNYWTPSQLTTHGYTGSLKPGAIFWETTGGPYPGATGGTEAETNSEPILQGEITTAIGDNTFVARYYHANVNRLIDGGTDSPFVPLIQTYTYWGVNHEAKNYTAYNGTPETTAFFSYYRQYELDRLDGYSAEFTHPYGTGSEATLSWESTAYQTNGVGSLSGCAPGANSAGQFAGFLYANTYTGGCAPNPYLTPTIQATHQYYPGLNAPSTTVPGGASQIWNTYMLRNILNVTPKIQWIATLYDNTYRNTFPAGCVFAPGWYGTTPSNFGRVGASCAVNGFNTAWMTTNTSHFDERTALEWRPDPQIAVRLSAGSAIAPPYLAELTHVAAYPSCRSCTTVTVNQPNFNLKPETAWGYDLGGDYAFADGDTFASVDLYLTNLYNHFITSTAFTGALCTSVNYPGSGCPASGVPILYSQNENVSNSRFEGVEASLRHVPANGFGFHVSSSVEHAYAYNLASNFYCSFIPTTTHPCIPANYNTNLNIVPGENFAGNATNAFGGFNGFSNTNIPYWTGNLEVNWRTQNGWYALFGTTLLGKNNSFNAPPFKISYASLRVPLNDAFSLEISGDNIFNSLPGYFEYIGPGVPYTLANGELGASIENQLGPAVYHVELTKTFSSP